MIGVCFIFAFSVATDVRVGAGFFFAGLSGWEQGVGSWFTV